MNTLKIKDEESVNLFDYLLVSILNICYLEHFENIKKTANHVWNLQYDAVVVTAPYMITISIPYVQSHFPYVYNTSSSTVLHRTLLMNITSKKQKKDFIIFRRTSFHQQEILKTQDTFNFQNTNF